MSPYLLGQSLALIQQYRGNPGLTAIITMKPTAIRTMRITPRNATLLLLTPSQRAARLEVVLEPAHELFGVFDVCRLGGLAQATILDLALVLLKRPLDGGECLAPDLHCPASLLSVICVAVEGLMPVSALSA